MTLYSRYSEGPVILEEQSISLERYGGYAAESVRTTKDLLEDYEIQREQGEIPGMLPESPLISAEEARRRVSERNLPGINIPEDGIRERVLDIIIDAHNRNRKLAVINEMAPEGAVSTTYGLLAQLYGSLFDPVELGVSLGSVLIPGGVFARGAYAGSSILARSAARFGLGFGEAAAGQTVLEPLIYDAARRRQEDYDLYQSFLNIVVGGLLGGGLHTIGGLAGDLTRRVAGWVPQPELPRLLEPIDTADRARILGLGVRQAGLGRPIDVEAAASPVLSRATAPVDFDVGYTRPLRFVTSGDAININDRVIVPFAARAGEPPTLREGIVTRIADDGDPIIRFAQDMQQTKIPRERVALYEPNRGSLAPTEEGAPIRLASRRETVRATPAEAREFKDALRAVERGQDITPEMRANLIQRGFLTEGGEITDLGRAFNRVAMPRIAEEATTAAAATRLARSTEEPSEVASAEAARHADTVRKEMEAVEENIDELVSKEVDGARQTAAALGDENLVNREMADADELIQTAGEYGDMVRAYANCIIRRGA